MALPLAVSTSHIDNLSNALAKAQIALAKLSAPASSQEDLRYCLSQHSKGNEWEQFPAVRFPDTSDEEYAAKLMAPDTQAKVAAGLVKAGRLLPVSLERLEEIVSNYVAACLATDPPQLDHALVVLLGAHTTVGAGDDALDHTGAWPTPIEITVKRGSNSTPYRFLHCKANEKQRGKEYERVIPIILSTEASQLCTMEVLQEMCKPRIIAKTTFAQVANRTGCQVLQDHQQPAVQGPRAQHDEPVAPAPGHAGLAPAAARRARRPSPPLAARAHRLGERGALA
eukprot:m.13734 g.13734  ORF g.13734 m.13734 type:complete len:283 (-) comp6957_c0_seq1:43-891(-)